MNHIKCALDVTQKPYYDTDCGIYVGNDGNEMLIRSIDVVDEDTEDWTGVEELIKEGA